MRMGSGIGWKQMVLVFVGALAFYAVAFLGVQHLRQRRGPWLAEFGLGAGGEPEVRVRQERLGIHKFVLRFPGEQVSATNLPGEVRFDLPGRTAPFGEVIYEDLTFLPGVVTLNLFGHEVEFLPRILIVNKREVPWSSEGLVLLQPGEKPVRPPRSPEGRR